MSTCRGYDVERLPDIEIYGGDTSPWTIELINSDGTPYQYSDLSSISAILTLSPYKISVGQGDYANSIPPVLTINGEISRGISGGLIAIFTFFEEYTKSLHGKYVYQVEVTKGSDIRISQGHILIKHNIHR